MESPNNERNVFETRDFTKCHKCLEKIGGSPVEYDNKHFCGAECLDGYRFKRVN